MRITSSWSFSLGAMLFSLALLPVGCGDDAEKPAVRQPQDFLPQVLGGMVPEGDPTIATTLDELRATSVNGGFQPFVDNNFQEFVQQFYLSLIHI